LDAHVNQDATFFQPLSSPVRNRLKLNATEPGQTHRHPAICFARPRSGKMMVFDQNRATPS
jgi:hypothetical protein